MVLSNSPLDSGHPDFLLPGARGRRERVGGDEPTIATFSMLIDHLFLTRDRSVSAGS